MAAICKDCKIQYDGFSGQMVMLHDHLWESISDDFSDCLCDKCIESRLGRSITEDDLKFHPTLGRLPVNELWLRLNKH